MPLSDRADTKAGESYRFGLGGWAQLPWEPVRLVALLGIWK